MVIVNTDNWLLQMKPSYIQVEFIWCKYCVNIDSMQMQMHRNANIDSIA